MRKRIISSIVLLLLVLMLSVAAASESQLIRVGILREVSEVTISAYDGFDIIDLQSGITIASDLDSMVLKPGYMGVRLAGEEDKEYFQVLLKPHMSDGIQLNYLEAGGKPYRGNIEVRHSTAGKLTVINELSVDEYVMGVVSKEMLAWFEPEALKAQAVIARTYGLHHLNKHASEGFDVCVKTHCQVYDGVRAETTATNQAVEETQGEVLTYNGQLINAVFHSSSGDHTENNENVWFTKGSEWAQPYLRGVSDFDQDGKYASWEKTFTLDEVTQMLTEKGLDIGEFEGIDMTETGVSGQVKWATILGSRGESEVTGEQLRSYLGLYSGKVEIAGGQVREEMITEETVEADKLRTRQRVVVLGAQGHQMGLSLENRYVLGAGDEIHKIGTSRIFAYPFFKTTEETITVIDEDTDNITFKGKGKGHGVGLSQWGAQAMAELGYNYEEILKHYYTGVELEFVGDED